MGDRLRENTSTALFRIIAAITILDLVLVFIFANISSKPADTFIIIPSYMESLKSYYFWNTLSQCLSVFFVCLFVVCVLTALVGHKGLSLVFLGLGIAVFAFFFIMSVVPLFNSPRVEAVKLVRSDYDLGYTSKGEYTLYFNNGSKYKISQLDYEYGSKQKDYYVVMCGNRTLGAYSAKDHKVLES